MMEFLQWADWERRRVPGKLTQRKHVHVIESANFLFFFAFYYYDYFLLFILK